MRGNDSHRVWEGVQLNRGEHYQVLHLARTMLAKVTLCINESLNAGKDDRHSKGTLAKGTCS